MSTGSSRSPAVSDGNRFILLISLILLLSVVGCSAANVHIRVNQIGYHPKDSKVATVWSPEPFTASRFAVVNSYGKTVYEGILTLPADSQNTLDHYKFADFSLLTDPGTYRLNVYTFPKKQSEPFRISQVLYRPLLDSIVGFYRYQRCGHTNPAGHAPCHSWDASKIIGGPNVNRTVVVTGGWHDAGDYTKFLLTTAHTVYNMLLAYELFPQQFPDRDRNGYPDLLDEAKIGLDWMMKMHYQPDRLLIQVQDLKDQTVGWRLPEFDPLERDRPAYDLPSKAHCGSFTAAMALAYSRFKQIDPLYADLCIKHAQEVYALGRTGVPATSSGPDSMYYDKSDSDNMALGAIELYRANGSEQYLRDAIYLLERQAPVYWVSWGDVGGYAMARALPYYPAGKEWLEKVLDEFARNSLQMPFGYALRSYPWGSASIQTGIAGLAVLYYLATESPKYLAVADRQRDFILGANRHNVSLVSGFGADYPKNLHHQVAHLNRIKLHGALAGGFVNRKTHQAAKIQLETTDRFERFQQPGLVYFDDRHDYMCNEPTIANNAQLLLLIAFYCQGR